MIEKKNEFEDTIVNFAVVIRADISSINDLKCFLAQNECIDVIYQKYSFNRLFIREDGDADDRQ